MWKNKTLKQHSQSLNIIYRKLVHGRFKTFLWSYCKQCIQKLLTTYYRENLGVFFPWFPHSSGSYHRMKHFQSLRIISNQNTQFNPLKKIKRKKIMVYTSRRNNGYFCNFEKQPYSPMSWQKYEPRQFVCYSQNCIMLPV